MNYDLSYFCRKACRGLTPFILLTLMMGGTRAYGGELTDRQMGRVRECLRLLEGAQEKTAGEVAAGLARTPFPEENLQILEAEARVFDAIVREQNVVEPEKKIWLYQQIALNMAYLQFGGINIKQSSDTALNKMIRYKLREHISADLQQNKQLFELVDW